MIKYNTSIELIQRAFKAGLSRELCYYYKFKHVFVSSRLNGGSCVTLASACNLNERTTRRNVSRLKQLGWIRKDRNDLVIISLKELCSKFKIYNEKNSAKISFTPVDELDHVKALLVAAVLTDNYQKQRMEIDRKYTEDEIANRIGPGIEWDNKENGFIPDGHTKRQLILTRMSNKRFGEFFGMSAHFGSRMKKILNQKRLVKFEECIEKLVCVKKVGGLRDVNYDKNNIIDVKKYLQMKKVLYAQGLRHFYLLDGWICRRLSDFMAAYPSYHTKVHIA